MLFSMIKSEFKSLDKSGNIEDEFPQYFDTMEVDRTGGHGLIISFKNEDEFGNESIQKIYLESDQVQLIKDQL